MAGLLDTVCLGLGAFVPNNLKKFSSQSAKAEASAPISGLEAEQGSGWVSAELEIAPPKDLAEYESNFRYSSRTIPACAALSRTAAAGQNRLRKQS